MKKIQALPSMSKLQDVCCVDICTKFVQIMKLLMKLETLYHFLSPKRSEHEGRCEEKTEIITVSSFLSTPLEFGHISWRLPSEPSQLLKFTLKDYRAQL